MNGGGREHENNERSTRRGGIRGKDMQQRHEQAACGDMYGQQMGMGGDKDGQQTAGARMGGK